MDASGATSSAAELPRVLGPPWRAVPAIAPTALALDPPVARDASALAVYCAGAGSLVRCRTAKEAELRAEVASWRSGDVAHIMRGALLLRSGLWYWPHAVEAVDTRKALDPLNKRDRALIAKRLQREMVRAARLGEVAALEETLDVMLAAEWGRLSPAALDAVYEEVRTAIAGVGTTSAMVTTTNKAGETLLKVGERSRRAKAFGIPAAFRTEDARALSRLNGNMPFFVSNEYGRRVNAFVERDAMRILHGGVARGLDDATIGRDLHRALAGRVTGRTARYFGDLSSISVVRSSSWGQLTSYRDAGFVEYEWEAVMDGATCNICRMLHGSTFPVAAAIDQVQRAAQPGRDPDEAIMAEMPFYREKANAIHIAPALRGGPVGPAVAQVRSSAVGRPDARGSFGMLQNPRNAGGTMSPPAHGLCRCLTTPLM